MTGFDDLVRIVAQLRGDGGCPWDRAQTPETMRPYLLEEVYETVDAIDRGDGAELRKELGDTLFILVLLAQMAEERGEFSIHDVLADINTKMVHRHPHVFDPDHDVTGDEGEISSWEARKATEHRNNPAPRSVLDGVPEAMPALLRAHRITEKAARVGFDWPDLSGVRAKLDEEIGELDEAIASGDPDAITHELGDALFTLVNLGRFLPVGAEAAVRDATRRFSTRFRAVEGEVARRGATIHDTDLDTLEAIWQQVKREADPP